MNYLTTPAQLHRLIQVSNELGSYLKLLFCVRLQKVRIITKNLSYEIRYFISIQINNVDDALFTIQSFFINQGFNIFNIERSSRVVVSPVFIFLKSRVQTAAQKLAVVT